MQILHRGLWRRHEQRGVGFEQRRRRCLAWTGGLHDGAHPRQWFLQSQSATVTITVTSVNGFNAATALACGTLPKDTICTFSSSSITPAVSGTATSTLTITTDQKAAGAISQLAGGGHAPLRYSLVSASAALAFVLFPLFGARNRRLRRMLLTLSCLGILAVAIATGISGCGGGPTTPKGSYSIQVTGTAGSASHSGTFTLTVE